MSQKAITTFKSTSWVETPWPAADNLTKVTRATCEQTYRGDIEGEALAEYLITYRPDGNARFVGLERIAGSVAGKRGSFVLSHAGAFEHGVAKIELTIVADSGTDELSGITGGARFESPHAEEYELALDYEFSE